MNDVIKIPSFIILGLFLMIFLIGMCAKEEPIRETHWSSNWQEEWLKPERLQPANTGNSSAFQSRRTYKSSYDY